MAYLVLVRHGETEWNEKGLWTGLTDVSLTKKGREQSRAAAELLKDIQFAAGFTSKLKRGKETLLEIKKILEEQGHIYPVTTLSGLLIALTRKKILRRLKEGKRWVYVKGSG